MKNTNNITINKIQFKKDDITHNNSWIRSIKQSVNSFEKYDHSPDFDDNNESDERLEHELFFG